MCSAIYLRFCDQILKKNLNDFDPDTRDRFIAGAMLPGSWYVRSQQVRKWFKDKFLAKFNEVDIIIAQGYSENEAKLKGIEQFAIEAAIIKVHGSDVLNYIADQGVQVYGGMGFSEEAPMARAYRDARITKIYEGTNEIKIILLVGMIIKKIMKKEFNLKHELDFVNAGMKHESSFNSGLLSKEYRAIKNLKGESEAKSKSQKKKKDFC